jgi:hypothetical protein
MFSKKSASKKCWLQLLQAHLKEPAVFIKELIKNQ